MREHIMGGVMGDGFRFGALGLAAVIVFASGHWLARAGRPYSTALLTVHKLVDLAAVLSVGAFVLQVSRRDVLTPFDWIVVSATAVIAVALFATGGVTSAVIDAPSWVSSVHRAAAWSLAAFVTLAACLTLLGLPGTAGRSGFLPRTQPSNTLSGSDAGVGVTLPLGPELAVKLVSAQSTPPDGVDASAVADALWLVLDVTNSTEGTVTLASRPRRPEVLDAQGRRLEVKSTSVTLAGGGGGFGPASSRLGEPYLEPAGVMRTTLAVPMAEPGRTGRPLTIRYAPFLRYGAEFTVE